MDRTCSVLPSQQPPHLSTQELTEVFQRTLNIRPRLDENAPRQNDPPSQVELPPSHEQRLGYNPSQHYTHSAHSTDGLHPLQPAPHDIASRLLIQNDIAPSSLSKEQFALFQSAAVDQQARLVMLWRLAPPSNTPAEREQSRFATQTTLEREEQLAWHRYQQLMAGEKSDQAAAIHKIHRHESEMTDEEMHSGS